MTWLPVEAQWGRGGFQKSQDLRLPSFCRPFPPRHTHTHLINQNICHILPSITSTSVPELPSLSVYTGNCKLEKVLRQTWWDTGGRTTMNSVAAAHECLFDSHRRGQIIFQQLEWPFSGGEKNPCRWLVINNFNRKKLLHILDNKTYVTSIFSSLKYCSLCALFLSYDLLDSIIHWSKMLHGFMRCTMS